MAVDVQRDWLANGGLNPQECPCVVPKHLLDEHAGAVGSVLHGRLNTRAQILTQAPYLRFRVCHRLLFETTFRSDCFPLRVSHPYDLLAELQKCSTRVDDWPRHPGPLPRRTCRCCASEGDWAGDAFGALNKVIPKLPQRTLRCRLFGGTSGADYALERRLTPPPKSSKRPAQRACSGSGARSSDSLQGTASHRAKRHGK